MHTAAEDFEAHGQIVGSNRRLLLARLVGGKKRSGLGGHFAAGVPERRSG